MLPKELALEIVEKMSESQREDVKGVGAGDYEDTIRNDPRTTGWDRHDIAKCLDEIDRLCGFEE